MTRSCGIESPTHHFFQLRLYCVTLVLHLTPLPFYDGWCGCDVDFCCLPQRHCPVLKLLRQGFFLNSSLFSLNSPLLLLSELCHHWLTKLQFIIYIFYEIQQKCCVIHPWNMSYLVAMDGGMKVWQTKVHNHVLQPVGVEIRFSASASFDGR